jgi:hypothetical protein
MSRESKKMRTMIRTLLAASAAVAIVLFLAPSTAIRHAASTTHAAPSPANDRAAAPVERVSDKPRTPVVEGKSDSLASGGSSDPYSNVLDPYAPYSGDFTTGEPIPPAMLKRLEHAKGLLFDDEKANKGG